MITPELMTKIKVVGIHIFNTNAELVKTPEQAQELLQTDLLNKSISEGWIDSVYKWSSENEGKTPFINLTPEKGGHRYMFMGVDYDDPRAMQVLTQLAKKIESGDITIRDRRKEKKKERQNRKKGRR